MSGTLNRVMLIGHLGHDPEIHNMAGGKRLAALSLATSDRWTDRDTGEKKERTEWHRVVVLREGLVDVLQKYARKGAPSAHRFPSSSRNSWPVLSGPVRCIVTFL